MNNFTILLMETFKEFQEQQHHFNQALLQEIRHQQTYLEQRLEERDHLLLQSMHETLAVRKEIAATSNKKWWPFYK